MWRDDVIAEANTWIATKYHPNARIKGVGVDCGQLLIAVYESAGIIPPGDCNPGYYPFDWHLHRSEEKYLSWIKRYCDTTEETPLPGDIAVFQFGRCVSHAGIVLEWPKIIHSYVGMGVIISDVNESILRKNGKSRLNAIYRPRG